MLKDFNLRSSSDPTSLVSATLGLARQLEVGEILQEFVDQASQLTNSRFGMLATVDTWGYPTNFLYHGFSLEEQKQLTQAGLHAHFFAKVPDDQTIFVNDITASAQTDFATSSFPIRNFYSCPVQLHSQVNVRIFLADKFGDYTEADTQLLTLLTQAASVAIENARLYREAQNRERWISASQKITSTLLHDTDEEEALALIAQTVLEVAQADTALIILPSVGYTWACEIAEGYLAPQMLGVVFPAEGRAMAVLSEGAGMIVDSLQRASTMRVEQLRDFGPALYAPMMNREEGIGVLLLLRKPGAPEFESDSLPLAEALASQAAFVLEVVSARHLEDVAAFYDERDRIGRDLHDFAIQQLFATGMQLEAAKKRVTAGGMNNDEVVSLLQDSLTSVDESVRQIRQIVHSLRDKDYDTELLERIQRETSIARTTLGFAPGLVIKVDGQVVSTEDEELLVEVNNRIGADLSDDIVAVIREGISNVARHAKATAANIIVKVDGKAPQGQVTVRVIDNGRGIPLDRTRTSGLGNLRARARRQGGDCSVLPREDTSGTILTWYAPIFDE
ncbi:GAF domain-containing protein [Gleimia sp. 6138-11-ORH1]|uniref:sensor histidine kinase n=1 Tax=Gleimia sp. 6138-11-ORH1 TaxID=2973937 RepID=UPI002168F8E3|nr:GAF domain-containing protein [Gleimia sp. 6138-11-ORH1]MCS4484507.1 GAF domain-containing protein [Gleimia sp. 6138-11-ORH1]